MLLNHIDFLSYVRKLGLKNGEIPFFSLPPPLFLDSKRVPVCFGRSIYSIVNIGVNETLPHEDV
jgi:hypothetical protein